MQNDNYDFDLVDALAEVLNDPARASALKSLAIIHYKYRELHTEKLDTGTTIKIELRKYGASYKFRGKKPKSYPAVDIDAMVAAFSDALAPAYSVVTVVDATDHIILYVRKKT